MSISAANMIANLRKRGVRLSRRGDKLRVEPAAVITPEIRDYLVAHKAEVLALLTGQVVADEPPTNRHRPVVRFRLLADAPWAACIGAPGETVDSVTADLQERWPDVEVRL